ncbi:MAG: hypothetical protein QOJ09_2400, partial [Actinomycetota bacterium]|nr:hypothetical protein [Actinomycetota bacterium]
TVRLSFRPRAGATYAYRVEVESVTVTAVQGAQSRRVADHFVLRADHAVLAAGTDSSRVRVRLAGPNLGARTFEVRLDRAGQLAEVQRIEDLPASALGSLGLTEIFPAAAGAPPDRPLSPGERWVVDEPVSLPGQPHTRLRGSGRLTELGVVRGEKVARVESTFRLAVRGNTQLDQGSFALDGSQSTTATATHRLVDGAVQEVRAVTRGSYRLTLLPPAGTAGPAIPGTLTIEVRSHTSLIR